MEKFELLLSLIHIQMCIRDSLRNEENIREVIPFPMSGTAQDLMCGAPNEVTEQQLREVHIKVRD